MSIASPASRDIVRLVSEDDAPWADTGIGVLLKVVRFDLQRGTWVIYNRFRPGVQLQTHRHTGSVESVSDGPSTLEAYYALLEAQGDPRPDSIVV